MNEHISDDIEELTEEMFAHSWDILKKTKRDKYKFLFSGGDVVREICLSICQSVWRTE